MHRVGETMSKELLLFKPDSISQLSNRTAVLKMGVEITSVTDRCRPV
jgi:hypothetical protein